LNATEREDDQAANWVDRLVESSERRVVEWRRRDPARHCDISPEEREKTETLMQGVLDLMRAYRRHLVGR
jgi:hypothetical protein